MGINSGFKGLNMSLRNTYFIQHKSYVISYTVMFEPKHSDTNMNTFCLFYTSNNPVVRFCGFLDCRQRGVMIREGKWLLP